MKFIELPISGRLVNLDQITSIEHETIQETTQAIVRFTNLDQLIISHRDADFLVTFIQEQIHG